MRVKALGSAAGGGFPQWNCNCPNCSRLRRGVLKGRARTQTQLAVSPASAKWFLVNASPDLRQQILADPDLAPAAEPRSTPIAAIILTSADVDCVLGLLHLREFQPLHIYSTPSVRRALIEENTLFRTLERSKPPVRWETLPLDERILSLGIRLILHSLIKIEPQLDGDLFSDVGRFLWNHEFGKIRLIRISRLASALAGLMNDFEGQT